MAHELQLENKPVFIDPANFFSSIYKELQR
jgi:hypothetical protein